MYLKSKTSKSKTHKSVRESIRLNNKEGIQILEPSNSWLEQFMELKKEHTPFQQRALKHTKLIIKWWEN